MFNLHANHVTYALKVQVDTVFLMSFDISVKDSTYRSFIAVYLIGEIFPHILTLVIFRASLSIGSIGAGGTALGVGHLKAIYLFPFI